MKTTILGVLTILATVVNAAITVMSGGIPNIAGTISGVTAGIGLIHAADAPAAK